MLSPRSKGACHSPRLRWASTRIGARRMMAASVVYLMRFFMCVLVRCLGRAMWAGAMHVPISMHAGCMHAHFNLYVHVQQQQQHWEYPCRCSSHAVVHAVRGHSQPAAPSPAVPRILHLSQLHCHHLPGVAGQAALVLPSVVELPPQPPSVQVPFMAAAAISSERQTQGKDQTQLYHRRPAAAAAV